jgi:hypothetical protein
MRGHLMKKNEGRKSRDTVPLRGQLRILLVTTFGKRTVQYE